MTAEHEHGHHHPAAHDFKVGELVWADFGDALGNVKGYVLAPIARDAYTVGGANGPETKYDIQAPDGSRHAMAYRVTGAGEASGLTFKGI